MVQTKGAKGTTLNEVVGLFIDEDGKFGWKWRDSNEEIQSGDDESGWQRMLGDGSDDGVGSWFYSLDEH